ncbi:serine-rich adhesin for platelets-like [Mercenaria mercenaria]|uniref:serine-rich adhesin for platelets-like n=1 Tax=Mercenaria mercenaria TaxID=6596 RepID=UPI00234F9C6B|nr:serine-rich adhesin for platelets-like [Mercenaria mercenaria]
MGVMIEKMLGMLIKSVIVLTVIFTSVNLENVKNQTTTSTTRTPVMTTGNASCGSYRNNSSPEWSADCIFPDLYSIEKGECEPFTEVDCGNRSEPITPCEYPKSNCTRPKGENVSLCTCEKDSDLNFDMCLSLKDGDHAWPARHWSPFYVQCTSQRTLPSSCSGHSVIYNFFQNKCQLVYEVVNAAYNLSLSLDIPESLYHLISVAPTKFMHQTTQDISMTPTPTTNILIQKTPDGFGAFTDIRSTSVFQHGGSSMGISALSYTTPPLSDVKLTTTGITHLTSSVYNFELSTQLFSSSSSFSGGATDYLLEPSSLTSVSPHFVPHLPFETKTKFISTEVLPLPNKNQSVIKAYTIVTSSTITSVEKEHILSHSSDRTIESKKEQANIEPTPSSAFSAFANTIENILYFDSLHRVYTASEISSQYELSSQNLFSFYESMDPSFPDSLQTNSVFDLTSAYSVYPSESNTISDFSSGLESLQTSHSLNSVGTSSGNSYELSLLLSSVQTSLSSFSLTPFLPQSVPSSSSPSPQPTKSSTFMLTETSFSQRQSPSLTSLSSLMLVYLSSFDYQSSPVSVTDSLTTSKHLSKLEGTYSPLSTLVEKNTLLHFSSLSSPSKTDFFKGKTTSLPPLSTTLSLLSSSPLSSSVTTITTSSSSSSSSSKVSSLPPPSSSSLSLSTTLSLLSSSPLSSLPSSTSTSKTSSSTLSPPPSSSLPSSSFISTPSSAFQSASMNRLSSRAITPLMSSFSFPSPKYLPSSMITHLSMSDLLTEGRATSAPLSTTSHLDMAELKSDGRFVLKSSVAISQISPSKSMSEVLSLSKTFSATSVTTSLFSMTESIIHERSVPEALSETPILPSNVQTEHEIAYSTLNNLSMETSIGSVSSSKKEESASKKSFQTRGDSSNEIKPSKTFTSGSSNELELSTDFLGGSSSTLEPLTTFPGGRSSVLEPSTTFTSGSSSLLKPFTTFPSGSSSLLKPFTTFPSEHLSTSPRQTISTDNKAGGKSAEIQKNNETSIAIGVGVGGGIVLICLILLIVIIVLRKRKKRGRRNFFQVRLPPELFMTRSL